MQIRSWRIQKHIPRFFCECHTALSEESCLALMKIPVIVGVRGSSQSCSSSSSVQILLVISFPFFRRQDFEWWPSDNKLWPFFELLWKFCPDTWGMSDSNCLKRVGFSGSVCFGNSEGWWESGKIRFVDSDLIGGVGAGRFVDFWFERLKRLQKKIYLVSLICWIHWKKISLKIKKIKAKKYEHRFKLNEK